MDFLKIENLCKNFGGLSAVSELDFALSEQKIMGLIGPNGAGKTTIFNMITGFLRPDRGAILWQGRDIIGRKPNQIVNLGVSRTFQLVKPFPELSLYDNMRVACFSRRFTTKNPDRKSIDHKIRETARRIGLPQNLNLPASSLSQGDLRLLDIGRSLISEPDVLLLDEPLSGLSSIETRKLLELIRELNGEGLTMLIIEHKLKELMKIADRIVAIDFGMKIAEGTPREIVNHPEVIRAYLGKKRHGTA